MEGVFRQYPVRLAWAITIHKSQGLTFEHAIIDASHSFSHGQTYVALSRCRSLEGMVLSQPLSRSAIISDQTVDAFNGNLTPPTHETISALELQYSVQMIYELFDFRQMQSSYDLLLRCLAEFFSSKYPRVFNEYQQMAVVFKSLNGVADKFRVQYTQMLAADAQISNPALQDRIHKGAKYFWQKMGVITDLIKKTNLETENKTAKKQFQDRFSTFAEEAKLKESLLRYEQDTEFSVSDYLKKKAQFLLSQEEGGSSYKSSKRNRNGGGSTRGSDSKEPKAPKIPTKEISYNLFKQGLSIDQIAAERNLTKGTIIGHLTPYVKEGKIGLRTFISTSREEKIRGFMEKHPEIEHFGEIKEALGGAYEYWEIKLIHDLMQGDK